MTTKAINIGLSILLLAAFTGCGGGGSSPSVPATVVQQQGNTPPPTVLVTSTPAPTSATEVLQLVSNGSASQTTFPSISPGLIVTQSISAPTAGSGQMTIVAQTNAPTNLPTVQSMTRRPAALGVSAIVTWAYVSYTPAATMTFKGTPALTFELLNGFAITPGAQAFLAFYDPTNTAAGWTSVSVPQKLGLNTAFPSGGTAITLNAGVTYYFAFITGTAALATPSPTPSPAPTPTPTVAPTAGPGGGVPLAGPSLGPTPVLGWGPRSLANALQFPVQSGYNGAAETVAIVIDSAFNTGDLSQYLSYFQIPTTSRTINSIYVDGASTSPTPDQMEASLDVETIAGLSPGANIIVYVIPDLSEQHINDAYNQILSDGQAKIVSSSFGGCEFPGITQTTSSTIFLQGAAGGVAFMASSGDQGNECPAGVNGGGQPIYQQGVNYPASDPNVIGVGGTESTPTNGLLTTTAWNDTLSSNGQSATGGGISTSFTIPTFQNSVSGLASNSNRNVPDVALPAVAVPVYENGQWSLNLGTSWSAPSYAAEMAGVYQYCQQTSIVNPSSIPYTVYGRSTSAYLDVLSGNNEFNGATPFFAAKSGYDNTTGLGVPLGMPYAQTLCPNRVLTSVGRAATASVGQIRSVDALRHDVSSHSRGLQDLGSQSPSAQTAIQIVLNPSGNLGSEEQIVSSFLTTNGFAITKTFANHLLIDAQAPASIVNQVFATQLHTFNQGSRGLRYGPIGDATVPASILPYVSGISLDNIVNKMTPHAR